MNAHRIVSSILVTLLCAACGGASSAPPAAPEPPAPTSSTEAPAASASTSTSAPARRGVKTTNAASVEAGPESIVQVSFEPLVAGVRPGGRFLLAAHFRIAPGYRIAWKNPGEVGTATTVAFRAPPGFEVGEPQFPAPERYTAQGNYVGFGYEKETAIFVEVKAKASLGMRDVSRFDLDAGWVACKRECATERTSAFIELTTTYGNAKADDVEAALAPFKARLPKPLADVNDAEQLWKDALLVVKVPGATPHDFFPDGTATPAPTKTSFADEEARFAFEEAPRPGSRPLRGVLVAIADGKDAFYDVEAPLPGEEPKEKGNAKGKEGTKKKR